MRGKKPSVILNIFAFVFAFCGISLSKASGDNRLTLRDAETRAITLSSSLKASRAQIEASEDRAQAQYSGLLPRLSLDANYRYVSEVPKLQVGPITQSLGDNHNYSIGPTLTYTLWDTGARSDIYHSLEKQTESQREQNTLSTHQLLLSIRTSYVQAQMAQESLRLALESLNLSRSQNRDITSRYHSGSVSRLDALSSDTEVSNYELRVSQSRGELKASMADLEAWVGPLGAWDHLVLDKLDDAVVGAQSNQLASIKSDHPQLRAQQFNVESLNYAVSAQKASRWPLLQIQARTSLDYPNGPILERINQNTVSINLAWSLLDWGGEKNSISEKAAQQEAAQYQYNQIKTDLVRERAKAQARLDSLWEQRAGIARMVRQTEELAKLNYSTYKYGRLSFLEVEAANLKLLDAQIRKAQIDAQLLLQYQTIRYLSGAGEEK